jgi:hypothetical protein
MIHQKVVIVGVKLPINTSTDDRTKKIVQVFGNLVFPDLADLAEITHIIIATARKAAARML